MLLTDGMIMPIRASGIGNGLSAVSFSSVVTAAMILSRNDRLLHLQSGIPGERSPERVFVGDEVLHAGDVEVLRQQGELLEVRLDLRRFYDASGRHAELVHDVRGKPLRRAQPEPGIAAHVGISLLSE